MSENNTIETDETSAPPNEEVLVLPAEYFFTEIVEVPPALDQGELDDFAELSMEANAPFPLDQLLWGFTAAEDGNHVLLYAAHRDRLKKAGYKDLEDYVWVIPDFAALSEARFSEQVLIVLKGDLYDTQIAHPGGEGLPREISSRLAEPETADPTALYLRPAAPQLTEKGLASFTFEVEGTAPPSEGHWSPLTPDEKALWRADIRSVEFKTVERNARRTSALIARLTGYAALFAVFLLFVEGGLLLGQLWLNTQQAKVDEQATPVRRIEDKQSLMNKLDQVAQNELRPIAILTAANEIRTRLGDTGIVYDEAVIEDGNRLTLEGVAATINELNKYAQALRSSGNFVLSESPKSFTRGGKTTFEVTLDYNHTERENAVINKTEAAENRPMGAEPQPISPDATKP